MIGGFENNHLSNQCYVLYLPNETKGKCDEAMEWVPFSNTITNKTSCTACTLDNFLYVFGGNEE